MKKKKQTQELAQSEQCHFHRESGTKWMMSMGDFSGLGQCFQ